jgi:hypothetical protein
VSFADPNPALLGVASKIRIPGAADHDFGQRVITIPAGR